MKTTKKKRKTKRSFLKTIVFLMEVVFKKRSFSKTTVFKKLVISLTIVNDKPSFNDRFQKRLTTLAPSTSKIPESNFVWLVTLHLKSYYNVYLGFLLVKVSREITKYLNLNP